MEEYKSTIIDACWCLFMSGTIYSAFYIAKEFANKSKSNRLAQVIAAFFTLVFIIYLITSHLGNQKLEDGYSYYGDDFKPSISIYYKIALFSAIIFIPAVGLGLWRGWKQKFQNSIKQEEEREWKEQLKIDAEKKAREWLIGITESLKIPDDKLPQ